MISYKRRIFRSLSVNLNYGRWKVDLPKQKRKKRRNGANRVIRVKSEYQKKFLVYSSFNFNNKFLFTGNAD